MKNTDKPDLQELDFKNWLAKGLDSTPNPNAEQILATARRPRRVTVKSAGLVAAVLVMTLLLSSLQMPLLARAFASLPVLGDTYTGFISGYGLNVAYQAGLVEELGISETQGGITLTVLAACSDALETVVAFVFESDDPALLYELWSKYSSLDWELTLGSGFTPGFNPRSSQAHYNQQEGRLYVMARMDPLPRWTRKKLTLTAELREWKPTLSWDITFPVQTLTDDKVETIKLDRTLEYEDVTIQIEEVKFSPLRTMLRYTVQHHTPEGREGLPKLTASPIWLMETETGEKLDPIGGGGSDQSGYEHYFPATKDRTIKLILRGFWRTGLEPLDARLPLEQGAKFSTSAGDISIGEIRQRPDTTEVDLVWDGLGSLSKGKLEAALVSQQGERLRAELQHTEAGITLKFNSPPRPEFDALQLGSMVVLEELEQVAFDIPKVIDK